MVRLAAVALRERRATDVLSAGPGRQVTARLRCFGLAGEGYMLDWPPMRSSRRL